MPFSDDLDTRIKELEKQKLPTGIERWYETLPADTADAQVANLAAWALALLSHDNTWQIAAMTASLSEDDIDEVEQWLEDMIHTRRGIDGPQN